MRLQQNAMNLLNHEKFYAKAKSCVQRAGTLTTDINLVILSSIALYYEHNLNIAYLNRACDVLRANRGGRVNAGIAFLRHFSDAKTKKDGNKVVFRKASSKNLDTLKREFAEVEDWIDWADRETPEPEFNEAKAITAIHKVLINRARVARNNGANELADRLEADAAHYQVA